MAVTKITDVIVPEIFTPYVQNLTEEKIAFSLGGAVVRNPVIDDLLAGGGLTFNVPNWKDLANDEENTVSDDDATLATPKKTGTFQEVAVRLSRHQAWSSMDLAAVLAGSDPMESIANRVAYYWARRAQAAMIATLKGVFADNAAAPSGSEHVQDDLTVDIKGASYTAGVTDFNAESFIDACTTLGDSAEDVTAVAVHSIVYSRMQKNNLIDFIPDASGQIMIPTYLGRRVIVDDGMPASGGVYESWLFGTGVVQLGVGSPAVPTEIEREASAGNGGGQDILHNRVMWCLHPTGHAYVGTAPNGGPTNAATTNNLADAGSWARRAPERKQIKLARLITREA